MQSHKREIGDKPPDPAEVARQLPPPSPTHVCFFFPEYTRHLCQIARSLVYTLSIMRLSIGISLLYFSLLVTSFPHSIPRDVYTRSLTVPDGLDSTLRIRGCTNSKQAGCEDEISLPSDLTHRQQKLMHNQHDRKQDHQNLSHNQLTLNMNTSTGSQSTTFR